MNEKDLDNKAIDVIASGISAAVGMVPLAGGFLSEIVKGVIPNQRQDRIVEFIKEINIKLQGMEYSLDKLENIFENYKYGAFTYKCLRNVVNEVYSEKIEYYRNICISGLTGEEKELNRKERILNIFSDMDYFEILYLKFYYYLKWYKVEQLEQIKKELGVTSLKPDYIMNMPRENFDQETFKQVTLNNLTKNGLLEQEIKNIGSHGKTKIDYKITNLGELILKEINLVQ